MKKEMCFLLSCLMVLSFSQSAFALPINNLRDYEKEHENLKQVSLSLKEKEEIFGETLSAKEGQIFVAKDVDLAKSIYNIDTEEKDREMASQGFVKVEETIYVMESKESKVARGVVTRIVLDENYYNKPAKQVNSKEYGMRHWLDVAFTLTLGEGPKIVSTAATILGVNASDFLPEWRKGDILEKSESKILREKWVQVKTDSGYLNAGRATKEDITVYIDLRTAKEVNGSLKAYRDSNEKEYHNITKYFNSESKLKSATISNAMAGDLVVSFYEDPWVKR
mgnify:CR=1 FL=1